MYSCTVENRGSGNLEAHSHQLPLVQRPWIDGFLFKLNQSESTFRQIVSCWFYVESCNELELSLKHSNELELSLKHSMFDKTWQSRLHTVQNSRSMQSSGKLCPAPIAPPARRGSSWRRPWAAEELKVSRIVTVRHGASLIFSHSIAIAQRCSYWIICR